MYLGLYALYFAVALGARIAGWLHGDAIVFVQSARRVVDGSFDLYGILRTPFIAPPLGTAYSYSSLLPILLAPVVWLSDSLRLENLWAMRLVAVPMLLADVLAMDQLRRLAREWRPQVDERLLLAAVSASLFLTSFLWVTGHKSHPEGMVLLFVLLTLRYLPRNILLSGLFAGMSLSTKHMTALLALIPVGLVLLFAREQVGTRARGGLGPALAWGAVALGVFALFLLPGVLSDPQAAYYALVTQTERIVALGPGLPRWVANAAEGMPGGAPWKEAAMQYSTAILLVVLAAVCLVVTARAARHVRPLGLRDTRLLGLVALSGVLYIVLAKWVSDHYYQMPLALIFLWDIVRTSPREGEPPRSGLAAAPWLAVGSVIAYRGITQIEPVDYSIPVPGQFGTSWIRDALLLALFLAVAALMLWQLMRDRSGGAEEEVVV